MPTGASLQPKPPRKRHDRDFANLNDPEPKRAPVKRAAPALPPAPLSAVGPKAKLAGPAKPVAPTLPSAASRHAGHTVKMLSDERRPAWGAAKPAAHAKQVAEARTFKVLLVQHVLSCLALQLDWLCTRPKTRSSSITERWQT